MIQQYSSSTRIIHIISYNNSTWIIETTTRVRSYFHERSKTRKQIHEKLGSDQNVYHVTYWRLSKLCATITCTRERGCRRRLKAQRAYNWSTMIFWRRLYFRGVLWVSNNKPSLCAPHQQRPHLALPQRDIVRMFKRYVEWMLIFYALPCCGWLKKWRMSYPMYGYHSTIIAVSLHTTVPEAGYNHRPPSCTVQ